MHHAMHNWKHLTTPSPHTHRYSTDNDKTPTIRSSDHRTESMEAQQETDQAIDTQISTANGLPTNFDPSNLNIGDLVKEKGLHTGWNEEWQSYDVDEDKVKKIASRSSSFLRFVLVIGRIGTFNEHISRRCNFGLACLRLVS